MTLTQFQFLPATSQLTWVLSQATYLAHRWEGDKAVSLFHLPLEGAGFFAEVGVNEAQDAFVLLRSFGLLEVLDEYAVNVCLPTL